jgi:superfamily IV 4 TMS phage holin
MPTAPASPETAWILAKIAIRFVVFAAVFWLAARKNPKVVIRPRWALPLVALAFSALNIGLYWLAAPILTLATFGSLAFVVPFFLNGLFLYLTDRLLRPLDIQGALTMAWLAVLLTVAHGALWAALDWLPLHI